MKQILLSTLFFLVSYCLPAQVSLKLSPDLVEIDVDKTQFETVAHSMLINTSDTIKTFRWVRKVESITMGWQSAICDNNACYNTEIDSTPSDFYLELAPGDSSILDVHVRPGGLEGSARIKVLLEEVGNPDNSVEGTFLFNETLSPVIDVRWSDVRLFPNPVESYFQLTSYEGVSRVLLYTIAGSLVKEYISYPGEKFEVVGQQRGMYLVRLMDRERKILKTMVMHKK